MRKGFKGSLALALVLASSSSVIADVTPAPSVSQQYVRTGGDIREVKETISNLQAQLKQGNLSQQDINKLASELSALNKELELQDVSNNQEVQDIFNDAAKLVNTLKEKGNVDTTKVDTQLLILGNKLIDTVDAVSTVAPSVSRAREAKATPSRSATRQVKSFSDVKAGAWYHDTVMELVKRGGVAGYEDGTFKPNNTITFSEFLKMSMSSATSKDYPAEKGHHWASGVHKAAVELGIIDGREFAGTNEVLNKPISREDMALILVNINEKIQGEAKVNTSNTSGKINDFDKVSKNRQTYILQAYEKGLLAGKGTTGFSPFDSTTRAEAATVIVRALDSSYRVDPNQPTDTVPEGGNVVDLRDPNRKPKIHEGDTVIKEDGTKVVVTMGRDYLGQDQGINFFANRKGADGKPIKEGSTGISVFTHEMVSPELIAKFKSTGAVVPNTLNGRYIKMKNGDYMMSEITDIIHQAYFMDLPNVSTQKIGDTSKCGFYKVVPHEAGGGRGIWEMQL